MAIPPATGAAPPQASPLPPGTTGTILQLPPSLGPVQAGDTLEGVVTARLTSTAVAIETSSGPLTLRVSQPLALNTQVLLRITLAGEQPAVAVTRQAQNLAAELSPTSGSVSKTSANIVTATVIRSTAANQPGSTTSPNAPATSPTTPAGTATLSNLPSGTTLPIRIIGVTPPAAAGNATAANRSATIPVPSASPTVMRKPSGMASSTERVSTASTPPATGPGTSSQQGVTPKGTIATPPGSSTIFSATIRGTNLFGQPIIQSGTLELALPASRPLPTGGMLRFESVGLPQLPVSGASEPQTLAVASRWEALNDALTGNISPATRTAVAQAIPQPNPKLAGTILFFMAALRGGAPRNWLGVETAKMLDADGLFSKIAEEFGVMQRLAAEPAGQDWKMFLIPFLSDSQLQQIRLFVRERHDEAGDVERAAGVRFVIEASFSRLGPFQFDGLVQTQKMSLVIRTEQTLEERIRRDISEIYTTSLQALGFSGSIDFRAERFFEVNPLLESGFSDSSGVTA